MGAKFVVKAFSGQAVRATCESYATETSQKPRSARNAKKSALAARRGL
jgi:hypothetical protein